MVAVGRHNPTMHSWTCVGDTVYAMSHYASHHPGDVVEAARVNAALGRVTMRSSDAALTLSLVAGGAHDQP